MSHTAALLNGNNSLMIAQLTIYGKEQSAE
jgi:hypothetical protein